VDIKGFRKGKVPSQLVESPLFRQQIVEEANHRPGQCPPE
jgi:FKBP-type peptidyl-prolyl cis-trans isomerase (trigger factor)